MEDKFILTTKDSFESDKQWILDNTCLEWGGGNCECQFLNTDLFHYAFIIRENIFGWDTVSSLSSLTPILLNDKTKQELKEKYGAKTWCVKAYSKTNIEQYLSFNGADIKAASAEDAIRIFRKFISSATITSVVQHD